MMSINSEKQTYEVMACSGGSYGWIHSTTTALIHS